MTHSQLIDRHKRTLNYLRVSITDRCNLDCSYCRPSLKTPKLLHRDILRYEEILRIVRIGVRLGIRKIRVTGGEPLVRKGVYGFLDDLCSIDGLSDVSLTTNGVLLGQNLEKIRSAGVRRINISLDTLNREKYSTITGSDRFSQVWDGIVRAVECGFDPVKINVVALKGVNDDEFLDLARLTLSYPVHVRFIEYMPIGESRVGNENALLAPEIKRRLEKLGELIPLEKTKNDGPAERYRFENAPGEIGLIRPITHHFCDRCNRLRLTASGKLKPCLLSNRDVDLREPLRHGLLDDALEAVFLQAVHDKPTRHHLNGEEGERVVGQMCAIGG